jgi:uncharacterized repeat protein (TIGR03803 family)
MRIKLLSMFLLLATIVPAQTFTILHQFQGGSDGYIPSGQLTMDAQGNLYGATLQGGIVGPGCGSFGCGTIFELSAGSWQKTTQYQFPGGSGGMYPNGGLVLDTQGNLYGTTQLGGNADDCGTVFKLSQGTLALLHVFEGKDGCGPTAGLAVDSQGNFYGSASHGGVSKCDGGCGTIFEVTAAGQFEVLTELSNLWYQPDGPLTVDAQGNLYGTTMYGIGKMPGYGVGVAFKLYLLNGKWYHQFLHTFNRWYQEPYGGVSFDQQGNLYGVTLKGVGAVGSSVYQIFPAGKSWQCAYLEKFAPKEDIPESGITVGPAGNIYGVTSGELFELTPGGDQWSFSVVYPVTAAYGNVIVDAKGNVYGVAGGGSGMVWEVQP